jgi:hypothetical protein
VKSNWQADWSGCQYQKSSSIAWLRNVKLSYTGNNCWIDLRSIDIQPGQLVQPGQSLLYHQQQWSLGNSLKILKSNSIVTGKSDH